MSAKQRVRKKRSRRADRYVARELKRHRGWHNLASIKVGIDRVMAAIDGGSDGHG